MSYSAETEAKCIVREAERDRHANRTNVRWSGGPDALTVEPRAYPALMLE